MKTNSLNTLRWLLNAACDWLIIIICMIIIHFSYNTNSYLAYLVIFLAIIAIGTRQHAIAFLGHDGAHYLVSRNKLINDLLTGILCFWPLGFPLNGYRRFHFKHHQFAGTSEDPELIHKNHRWLGQWNLPLIPLKVSKQICGDAIGGGFPHLVMAAKLTRANNVLDQLYPSLTLISLLFLFWWFNCLWVPAVWFISIITTFWIVFRLRMWTEHTVEDKNGDPTHRFNAPIWARLLFLPHNTYHHWEHHYKPQTPFYDLPKLREMTKDSGPPILSFYDLFKKLKKK